MATFNGERFIAKQLQSILNQLSPTDEIIISDDSSTDDTVNIIKKFDDSRILLIENQTFKSPLLNFENALKYASGTFVFLSDQDDIWYPHKVETVIPLLMNYDLVLTDCRVVDEKGAILHRSFFDKRSSKPGFWYNLYKNSYVGCCMAFRQEVLKYALPFPQQVHMHDWWIGLLVEAKGRVCFYPEPLIYYVRHQRNASPTLVGGYNPLKRIMNRLLLLIHLSKRLLSRHN